MFISKLFTHEKEVFFAGFILFRRVQELQQKRPTVLDILHVCCLRNTSMCCKTGLLNIGLWFSFMQKPMQSNIVKELLTGTKFIHFKLNIFVESWWNITLAGSERLLQMCCGWVFFFFFICLKNCLLTSSIFQNAKKVNMATTVHRPASVRLLATTRSHVTKLTARAPVILDGRIKNARRT